MLVLGRVRSWRLPSFDSMNFSDPKTKHPNRGKNGAAQPQSNVWEIFSTEKVTPRNQDSKLRVHDLRHTMKNLVTLLFLKIFKVPLLFFGCTLPETNIAYENPHLSW